MSINNIIDDETPPFTICKLFYNEAVRNLGPLVTSSVS